MNVTHYGYNHTDRGKYNEPHVWIPVKVNLAFIERLRHLVDREPRLCRIWIQFKDGTRRCIYWYQQHKLDLDWLDAYLDTP